MKKIVFCLILGASLSPVLALVIWGQTRPVVVVTEDEKPAVKDEGPPVDVTEQEVELYGFSEKELAEMDKKDAESLHVFGEETHGNSARDIGPLRLVTCQQRFSTNPQGRYKGSRSGYSEPTTVRLPDGRWVKAWEGLTNYHLEVIEAHDKLYIVGYYTVFEWRGDKIVRVAKLGGNLTGFSSFTPPALRDRYLQVVVKKSLCFGGFFDLQERRLCPYEGAAGSISGSIDSVAKKGNKWVFLEFDFKTHKLLPIVEFNPVTGVFTDVKK